MDHLKGGPFRRLTIKPDKAAPQGGGLFVCGYPSSKSASGGRGLQAARKEERMMMASEFKAGREF
ncbi:MAG: hypothetical protein RID59_17150, partial [Hoeflea sp.]